MGGGKAITRLLFAGLMTSWLSACGSPKPVALSLDPAGSKLPPRGYVVFCREHALSCKTGAEQTIIFTRQRWAQLVAVNALFNATILPETDEEHLHVLDHWDIPDGVGDCEDYVLAKRARLVALGFPRTALLIGVVDIPHAPVLRRRHAVLLAVTDLGNYVLDNRVEDIKRWTETDYIWVAVESTSHPGSWQAVKRKVASR